MGKYKQKNAHGIVDLPVEWANVHGIVDLLGEWANELGTVDLRVEWANGHGIVLMVGTANGLWNYRKIQILYLKNLKLQTAMKLLRSWKKSNKHLKTLKMKYQMQKILESLQTK